MRTGGGPVWHAFQMGLPALAAAVVALWGGLHLAWPGWALATAALLAATAAAVLAHRARVTLAEPGAELRFDGDAWTLAGAPGQPEVAIDLQRWLLLRFVEQRAGGAGGAGVGRQHVRWVAVSAADAGAALHALRVALHAPSHSAGARPSTAPPAADR